ncbi:hypothetical protein KCM76_05570 [Zooshikella marina]|uniref:contractile injection system tape measure protein n=1 Tax=Zooshikella ganghwensis TaxID=202772 RepID=UPI001BAEA721|nr:contractile injection system tape measure protein [Zooshikella ganghwensis]MBU2705437.1 hypothetical protein [Zooshikella ganghwensis]
MSVIKQCKFLIDSNNPGNLNKFGFLLNKNSLERMICQAYDKQYLPKVSGQSIEVKELTINLGEINIATLKSSLETALSMAFKQFFEKLDGELKDDEHYSTNKDEKLSNNGRQIIDKHGYPADSQQSPIKLNSFLSKQLLRKLRSLLHSVISRSMTEEVDAIAGEFVANTNEVKMRLNTDDFLALIKLHWQQNYHQILPDSVNKLLQQWSESYIISLHNQPVIDKTQESHKKKLSIKEDKCKPVTSVSIKNGNNEFIKWLRKAYNEKLGSLITTIQNDSNRLLIKPADSQAINHKPAKQKIINNVDSTNKKRMYQPFTSTVYNKLVTQLDEVICFINKIITGFEKGDFRSDKAKTFNLIQDELCELINRFIIHYNDPLMKIAPTQCPKLRQTLNWLVKDKNVINADALKNEILNLYNRLKELKQQVVIHSSDSPGFNDIEQPQSPHPQTASMDIDNYQKQFDQLINSLDQYIQISMADAGSSNKQETKIVDLYKAFLYRFERLFGYPLPLQWLQHLQLMIEVSDQNNNEHYIANTTDSESNQPAIAHTDKQSEQNPDNNTAIVNISNQLSNKLNKTGKLTNQPYQVFKQASKQSFSSLKPSNPGLQMLKDLHRYITGELQANISADQSHPMISEYQIENAGVVLLTPWFTSLFNKLGWLKNNQFFINDNEEYTAYLGVNLLNRLNLNPDANGFTNPLHQIFCGLGVDETIDVLELPEQAEAELVHLQQAVIAHWQHFNQATITSLQQLFIRRPGVLTSIESGWVLTVSRENQDVLLQHLPWSFNTVKLPWMNSVLAVHWSKTL